MGDGKYTTFKEQNPQRYFIIEQEHKIDILYFICNQDMVDIHTIKKFYNEHMINIKRDITSNNIFNDDRFSYEYAADKINNLDKLNYIKDCDDYYDKYMSKLINTNTTMFINNSHNNNSNNMLKDISDIDEINNKDLNNIKNKNTFNIVEAVCYLMDIYFCNLLINYFGAGTQYNEHSGYFNNSLNAIKKDHLKKYEYYENHIAITIVEERNYEMMPALINVYDYPNVNFVYSVVSSMSIPILFQRAQIDEGVNKQKIYAYDGGCFENFPMFVFDESYKCSVIAPL